MGAYFARRLVGGVVTVFLAGLLIYSFVVYGPSGVIEQRHMGILDDFGLGRPPDPMFIRERDKVFNTDKPWPISYLAWLFDPSDNTSVVQVYDRELGLILKDVPKGVDADLFGLHLLGSGVLSGDLSTSTDIERGQQVTDVFGRGVGELMLLSVLLLFAAMTLVAAQRRRRPHANEHSREPFLPRPLHYRTSAMNELFRVQIGGNL